MDEGKARCTLTRKGWERKTLYLFFQERAMIRRICTVCLAVLMVCGSVGAENKVSTGDEKTDEMMVAVQAQLKDLKSCTARLTTQFKLMGEEIEDEADAAFQAPDRIRFETAYEGKRVPTFLVDGGEMWMYDPEENLVTRFNRARIYRETDLEVDAYVLDPLRPFRGLKWQTIRYVGEEAINGQNCRAFEAEPEFDLLHAQLPVIPTRVRLMIHAGDGLLRTASVFDDSGAEIVVRRFDNVKVNPRLAADFFEFVIPSGAYVIDATDDTVALLKATSGKR